MEDRTKEDYLLILNQNNRVSNESQITKLENNVEKIFTFFKNNRNKLLEKDAPYENSFNKSNEVFREYILAIKDYTNYRVEYVEKNRLLLSGSGDEGTDVTTGSKVVTAKDVLEYFEGFSYLGLKNVKISPRNSDYCNYLDEQSDKDTTEAPECYKVENLVINNRINMSFLFTPSDSNRISSIVID
ncbi:MAG: hypothetical protein LBC61_02610 [Candidatus Peribacteria bacterium]|nr:hypothetical protein [Candidatus Peribacteria bacterium]